MMGHVNSGVLRCRTGDSPSYYQCAIICISGPDEFHRPRTLHTDAQISLASRVDLEGYPRLAILAGNVTSIKPFHLRFTEASEGKQCYPKCHALSQESIPQP